MTTIVMDIEGCDIAHETLLLKEYAEEVRHVQAEPQPALASAGAAANNNRHANIFGCAKAFNIDPPAALYEVGDSVRFIFPSAFPKCP